MKVQQELDFDDLLDARGMRCPLPVLRTRKALKSLSTGQVLKVQATDPGARKDIASFCNTSGHALLAMGHQDPTNKTDKKPILVFWIRKM